MKFLSRQCCLSLALLASMSLVGCGGSSGGGHNPAPSPDSGLAEAKAPKAIVSPIVKNSDTILNGAPVTAAFRFSTSEDENNFNAAEANGIIKNLFNVDSFVRMATSLDGMVRDDGILFGGDVSYETYDRYIYGWVASLSGDVYERTKFEYDDESQKLIPVSVYKITGVSGSVKDNRLTSLNIKKGAKFEVKIENYNYNASNSWVKNSTSSITGTFNTAFGCKEEVVSSTDLNKEGRVYNYYNEDITDSKTETWGYKPVKEETRRITYTFGEGLGLTVENYSYEDIENGYKPVTGKLNVDFSGITGIVTKEGKVLFQYEMSRDFDYDPSFVITSDWYTDGYLNQYLSGDIITKENLTVKEPVNIAFTNIKAAAGKSNANIKNIQVIAKKVTKAAKIADSLFADVEAHIDVEATYKEEPIKIGTYVMGFTTAKIDVTGLKCQKEIEDVQMLANAKAKLEASEENSKIKISGDYDYAKKTANVKLINDGDTIVKEDTTEFNFKTADIIATNVDVLNNCEGALLYVTAIEKDGAISKRSYMLVDGKLVLQSKNDRIKVALPKDLPQSGNDIAKAAEEAKTPATAKDDATAKFKVGKKSDGSTVATFEKLVSSGKDVKINIAAKDKVIIAVGFYGSEFTIVFAFDTVKNIIEGNVFKGKVENAKLEDKNPVATFASTDGKTVTLFGDDSSSTTFNAAD